MKFSARAPPRIQNCWMRRHTGNAAPWFRVRTESCGDFSSPPPADQVMREFVDGEAGVSFGGLVCPIRLRRPGSPHNRVTTDKSLIIFRMAKRPLIGMSGWHSPLPTTDGHAGPPPDWLGPVHTWTTFCEPAHSDSASLRSSTYSHQSPPRLSHRVTEDEALRVGAASSGDSHYRRR